MTEITYIYIQKIYTSDFGRIHKLINVQGSQEELADLLKKYSIKLHNQESSIANHSNSTSVTFISHHYVLTPIFNNKV